MSELRDRLERLAARGSQRGADDVLNAAMRGAPSREVDVVPDGEGNDLTVVDGDVPFVTSEVESHRRGRLGTLVAAFGVAALIGVGALAITSVFGNGGASSPEGAVRQLADAISNKDPLAAVDVLSPTEVRSMRETVNNVTHRAADLKLVENASAPLAGVDLSVDHLQLSTQPLADGYTKVTVTSGELSASTHAAAMSKLLQDAIGHSGAGNAQGKVELARLASDSGLPTFVVTVRRDGRWYVSPAYTALEYAREAAGGPAADFGSAQAATDLGADTPEHAVADALHAWQASNWDRLMALAPPDELPVYDYRKWLDQLAAESKPDFTIDNLTTSSTINGDSATVKLDASGTMGSGQDQGKWQVGGSCQNSGLWYGYASQTANASSGTTQELFTNGPSTSVSPNTSPELCLSGDLGNAIPFGLIAIGADGTTPASGSVSIEVVRENGRWFVSPVTTVLKVLDSAIQHVDERSVYSLLGLAYQLPPDANITINQPFTVPDQTGVMPTAVLAFNGTKGQQVVGETASEGRYAYGEIYTAGGKDVDYIDFSTVRSGDAYPVTLPETGSYRLVITGSVSKGANLTLWDVNDAPKGLVPKGGSFGGGGSCTTTGPGETTCTSSSSSSSPGSGGGSSAAPTPITMVVPVQQIGSGSRSATATTSPGPPETASATPTTAPYTPPPASVGVANRAP